MEETYRDVIRHHVPAGSHPLPALFRFVQAIPYQFPGPRDAAHTLAHGWGTCAGKNYLLVELLRAAGLPARHMLATGDLRETLPRLPAVLRAWAEAGPLPDVHSLLTAVGPDGPVLVDASWDPPLGAYGFPVQGQWDGTTDTVVAFRPHALYAVCGDDPSAEKDALRARLYRGRAADRERRARYLTEMSAWLATVRYSGATAAT